MFQKIIILFLTLTLVWPSVGTAQAAAPTAMQSAAQSAGPNPPAPKPPTPLRRVPIPEYHTTNFQMGTGVMMMPEWFERQMRWLAENDFRTLTADELADYVEGRFIPPQKAVALTFDVGISNFADYELVIIPTLQKYGLHAIFFVLANRTKDECDGRLTCWPTLKTWVEANIISIGSHSLYHIDYATLTLEAIKFDAERSKAIIEQKLGVTVTALCYPYDSVTPAAIPILKAAGYRLAVAGPTRYERSVQFADAEPYSLPRYYPYSGFSSYPALVGMRGKRFHQVLWEAINLPGLELARPSALNPHLR